VKGKDIINKLEVKPATTATHLLNSQGQASSAKLQKSTTATHHLKSQG
jgi:hypothetical protein